jgi:hypothetical protein
MCWSYIKNKFKLHVKDTKNHNMIEQQDFRYQLMKDDYNNLSTRKSCHISNLEKNTHYYNDKVNYKDYKNDKVNFKDYKNYKHDKVDYKNDKVNFKDYKNYKHDKVDYKNDKVKYNINHINIDYPCNYSNYEWNNFKIDYI